MNNESLPDLSSLIAPFARAGCGLANPPTDGMVWLVQHGHIDLFLVPLAGDGTPGGAREHWRSLGSGQMFAFPPLDPALGYVLLAQPAPQTEFAIVPRQDIAALLEQAPARTLLLPWLAQWLMSVSCGKNEVRKDAQALRAGSNIASDEQVLTLFPESAGLWLEVQQGQAGYLGRDVIARLLPLPAQAWVELAPFSRVAALSLEDVCNSNAGLEVLQACDVLMCLLLDAAIRQQQKTEVDELSRLQRKSDLSRQAMADALGGLASLFDQRDGDLAISSDALQGACAMIGKALDIRFKRVPETFFGGGRRDPVKDLATASGVRTRVVALKGEWWRKDNGALLVFSEKGRDPYALLPLHGGYQMVDPVSGRRSILSEREAAELAQFGYMFYRGLPATVLGLRDILAFTVSGIRRELLGIGLIGLVSSMLAMVIPVASGHLFDTVFPAAAFGQMVQVVLMLLVASIVNLLFEATRALLMLRVEGRASSDLQAAVWDRVLNLPMPFFRQFAAGDLATRINGINEIRQALSGSVISSIVSSLFSVLNIGMLFYYSVKMAGIAVLLVLLAVLINFAIGAVSLRLTRQSSALNGTVSGQVLEYLSGITKLRVTGAEARAFANWAANFGAQKRLTMRSGNLAALSSVFGAVFPVLANVVLFSFVAMALQDKEKAPFSTGDFIAFSAVFTLFLNAMLALVHTGMVLLNIAPLWERTKPILETLPEVDESKLDPGRLAGAIELSNVSFAYQADGPSILQDVSISIKPGEFVALVGASGSGKSTLLRLMLGFEKPLAGGIYYDGHNLSEIDVGAVRRQLGVVLQGGRLMSGDIFTNIIGSTSLLLADAWAAARACGLDKDIEAMPMGMHTIVSDGGGTLSGGQRQRLLIARAIVHQPSVIFFDEATSALDNHTQAIVSSSMDKLRATRVVIAHRLSTVINADRIFVLDKGHIVQSGTYHELMQQDGLFAELAKRQIV